MVLLVLNNRTEEKGVFVSSLLFFFSFLFHFLFLFFSRCSIRVRQGGKKRTTRSLRSVAAPESRAHVSLGGQMRLIRGQKSTRGTPTARVLMTRPAASLAPCSFLLTQLFLRFPRFPPYFECLLQDKNTHTGFITRYPTQPVQYCTTVQ